MRRSPADAIRPGRSAAGGARVRRPCRAPPTPPRVPPPPPVPGAVGDAADEPGGSRRGAARRAQQRPGRALRTARQWWTQASGAVNCRTTGSGRPCTRTSSRWSGRRGHVVERLRPGDPAGTSCTITAHCGAPSRPVPGAAYRPSYRCRTAHEHTRRAEPPRRRDRSGRACDSRSGGAPGAGRTGEGPGHRVPAASPARPEGCLYCRTVVDLGLCDRLCMGMIPDRGSATALPDLLPTTGLPPPAGPIDRREQRRDPCPSA